MFLKKVKCNTIKCDCDKISDYKVIEDLNASKDEEGRIFKELWEDSGDGWFFVSHFPNREQGYYCYDCYETEGESK